MATVTTYNADRIKQIEDNSIVDISVDETSLTFTKGDGVSEPVVFPLPFVQSANGGKAKFYDNGDVEDDVVIDLGNGNVQKLTMIGDISSLTITGLDPIGEEAHTTTLLLEQGGVGGWAITAFAGVLWPEGDAPAFSTAVGAIDVVTLLAAGGNVFGFLTGKGMA